jgi:hypothetical protein
MLNSYLTGLIENSGTFAISNNKNRVKPCLPKLLILFKASDYHLIEELISITKIGVISKQENSII